MEEHMACRSMSLSGARRKVEESAKEAILTKAAKERAPSEERPSSCPCLGEQGMMEMKRVEEGAADSEPPQGAHAESAAPH
jgi:hypothetical protein